MSILSISFNIFISHSIHPIEKKATTKAIEIDVISVALLSTSNCIQVDWVDEYAKCHLAKSLYRSDHLKGNRLISDMSIGVSTLFINWYHIGVLLYFVCVWMCFPFYLNWLLCQHCKNSIFSFFYHQLDSLLLCAVIPVTQWATFCKCDPNIEYITWDYIKC